MTAHRWQFGVLMAVSAAAGAGTATFLAGGSVPLRAQATPAVLTVQQLNLVDSQGLLKGILSSDDERGLASLALLDAGGNRRAVLGVEPNGTPRMELYDDGGAARAIITVEGGIPAVVVSDDADRRAVLSSVTGSPTLMFQDGTVTRAELGLAGNASPRLALSGSTRQAQVIVSVDDANAPLVALRDEGGRSRASMTYVQGATVLNLSDDSAARIVLGVAPDANASLSFLDEAGNVASQVP